MNVLFRILHVARLIVNSLIVWKFISLLTSCQYPVVVVLSGSMEPAYHRGDLMFLTHYPKEPYRVGDIVVYKVNENDIPIVHRIIKLHQKENGTVKFLTKGDNNKIPDRGLYKRNQDWLVKEDIIGKVKGWFPYVGFITIVFNDYILMKYAVLFMAVLISIYDEET